jgi:Rap1a immunity proteins
MAKTRAPYTPEFRRQMVELVRAGRSPEVFCGYLRDRPERRSAPAAALFKEAMQKAWPCKK